MRPTLPAELWMQIFQRATDIPGAYSHNNGQALLAFSRDEYGIVIHKRHRETSNLLLRLIRVCKTWNALGTPCLFRYLLVKSGDHAIAISGALTRYAMKDSSSTIRLELALEGVHRWEESHTNAISRIISACPNVRVFSNVFCSCAPAFFDNPTTWIPWPSLEGVPALRRLELKYDFRLMDTTVKPLKSSLTALWLSPNQTKDTAATLPPVHLPALRILVVSEGLKWADDPSSWILPHLDALCLRAVAWAEDETRFLETHAQGLRQLSAAPFDPRPLELCSDLLEYAMPSSNIAIATSASLSPSIKTLTIADERTELQPGGVGSFLPSDVWYLHGFLEDDRNLPTLQNVGFLLSLRRVERRGRQREWLDAFRALEVTCRRRGVALEVSIGAEQHCDNVWTRLLPSELFQ